MNKGRLKANPKHIRSVQQVPKGKSKKEEGKPKTYPPSSRT